VGPVMPLDDVTFRQYKYQEWGLHRARNWHLNFCLWPRTCYLSGTRLWLTWCYKGSRIIMGPGDPVLDVYYISKFEYLLWQIKR
jgi:hypothetical protein